MDTVTLGSKGQVSIPKPALRKLGLEGGAILMIETTDDGAIVLRPAGVYPIEIYSEERLLEFAKGDRMDDATARRVKKVLARAKR